MDIQLETDEILLPPNKKKCPKGYRRKKLGKNITLKQKICVKNNTTKKNLGTKKRTNKTKLGFTIPKSSPLFPHSAPASPTLPAERNTTRISNNKIALNLQNPKIDTEDFQNLNDIEMISTKDNTQDKSASDTRMVVNEPPLVSEPSEESENADNEVVQNDDDVNVIPLAARLAQRREASMNSISQGKTPTIDDESANEEASIESQREALFKNILKEAKMRIKTDELIALQTKKGNTQASEQPSIALIKMILDELGLIYKQAGSQQSKDFRNVGGIGLDIEVKKTDSKTVIFNDTLPNSNIWYLIMFTGKKTKRAVSIPPGIMGINGGEFIKDSEWVHEYQQEIDAIKNKYCRGCGKRELSGIMKAYVRPTYSADITKFLKRLLE